MSHNVTNIGILRTVVAIAQEESKLKAVELRERTGAFEVLWTKSSEGTNADWRLFAAECGLSLGRTARTDSGINRMVAVGFNSAGIAFYRINVPAVGEEEAESMIRLQAETLLPLPAEQMEMAWRTSQMQNGQIGVTIAAARKEQLQSFVENVRSFEPEKILLDCEAIVEAWKKLFAGDEKKAVVVSIGAQNTQVCLVDNGRLSNGVVLSMGIEDFTAGNLEQQAETSERFVQDMRSVQELFGYANQAELPVVVLSDGNAAYVSVVSSLRSAGFDARVALPDINKLRSKGKTGVEDIYEYRVPIGLGLMALDARVNELNIFERLYIPASRRKKKHWFYSLKAACVITAVILVLLAVFTYVLDRAAPNVIEERLRTISSDTDIDLLMQRQKLIKAVALQRPDLLDLLSEVNACGDKGIKLESFYFKKGQPVTIRGQAPNNEQLYKFEKSLEEIKDIKNVRRTSSLDAKTKKLDFTMTFHYKNFTK